MVLGVRRHMRGWRRDEIEVVESSSLMPIQVLKLNNAVAFEVYHSLPMARCNRGRTVSSLVACTVQGE